MMPEIVDDDGCIPKPTRACAGPGDEDPCDHPDHSEESGPDSPDTDAGY